VHTSHPLLPLTARSRHTGATLLHVELLGSRVGIKAAAAGPLTAAGRGVGRHETHGHTRHTGKLAHVSVHARHTTALLLLGLRLLLLLLLEAVEEIIVLLHALLQSHVLTRLSLGLLAARLLLRRLLKAAKLAGKALHTATAQLLLQQKGLELRVLRLEELLTEQHLKGGIGRVLKAHHGVTSAHHPVGGTALPRGGDGRSLRRLDGLGFLFAQLLFRSQTRLAGHAFTVLVHFAAVALEVGFRLGRVGLEVFGSL
jgi:hypothetical protein